MTDQTDDKDESMDQVPDEPTPTDDNAAETGGGDTPSGAAAPDTNTEESEATGDSAADETEAPADSAAKDTDGSEDASADGDSAPSDTADADADVAEIAATGDSAAAGTDVEASTENETASSKEVEASTGETDPAAKDEDDMESAWADALAETEGADSQAGVAETAMTQPEPATHPADFPSFGSGHQGTVPANMDLLMDVKLPVSIELGRTTLEIIDILKWGPGSIVELDKLAGEPVNLLVNNKLVAKGEVVVVDENFGLRITSLVKEQDLQEGR